MTILIFKTFCHAKLHSSKNKVSDILLNKKERVPRSYTCKNSQTNIKQ